MIAVAETAEAAEKAAEKKAMFLEGLLPVDVWNALIVLLVLFGVFVAVFKGITMIRDEIRKNKEKKAMQGTDVTEQIATKVTERLDQKIDERFEAFEQKFDKKFEEIDEKLAADKETLRMHTAQLNAEKDRVDRLDNDTKALLHGMSALLGHEVDGNNRDRLQRTNDAMKNYLIDRKYSEDDWK